MRTRERGGFETNIMECTVRSELVKDQNPPTHTDVFSQSITNPTRPFSNWAGEAITDDPLYPGTFKGCTHTCVYPVEFPEQSVRAVTTNYSSQFNWLTFERELSMKPLRYIPEYFNESLPLILPPQSIEWSSLVQEVGEQLDGRLASSANILVEMAQLSQVIGMFKNPFNLLKPRTWDRKSPIGTLISRGANVWLEGRYGWQNLYISIKGIADVFQRAEKHIEYLLKNQGQFVPIHSRKSYEADLPTLTPAPTYPVANQFFGIFHSLTEREVQAAFGLRVKRNIPLTHLSKMYVIKQALGTDKFVEALWDLVPFSFVVDWFFDFGGIIELNPVYWNGYHLDRIGYSVKDLLYGSFDLVGSVTTSFGDSSSLSKTLDKVLIQKSYTRTGGFPPSTIDVGLFGGCNRLHLADGAALLIQKIL